MKKAEKIVFNYAKDRYLWEHERKNNINNMISIPLGIITAMFGCIAYFLRNLPIKSNKIYYIIFTILLALSIVSLIFCIIYFCLHQVGYKYAYISDPTAIYTFKQKYIENFKEANVKVDNRKIKAEIKKILCDQYIKASQINIQNNEKKIRYYRDLILTIIISIIFLSFTYIARMQLSDKAQNPLPIKIENFEGENSMGKKEEKNVVNATSDSVKVPKRPELKMVTESFNPIDFMKGDSKEINFSQNDEKKTKNRK